VPGVMCARMVGYVSLYLCGNATLGWPSNVIALYQRVVPCSFLVLAVSMFHLSGVVRPETP
jgi:hypothetical protein